jgi:predicted Zn-dependent protease
MRQLLLVLALLASPLHGLAQPPAGREGVDVGDPSMLRQLVPAGPLEKAAAQQYDDLKKQAAAKKALAPASDPQLQRLRGIANRLVPFSESFNPRAKGWQWEINLIQSQQINAFCMPGGKIAFFSGILDKLKLSDDEAAMVMGHEIAHALREHARERVAKTELTRLGASLLGELFSDGRYAGAFNVGGNLLTLRFSRDDESEADLVGLELAARAGYDPRAGVTLWQKMGRASQGVSLQWLSTHPSGNNRIREIERHLPQVMPLYEKAKAKR